LTSVFKDIVDELNFIGVRLSLRTGNLFSKSLNKQKRLKMSPVDMPNDLSIFRSLQPILLCLEYALKADAQEGRNWIQEDKGQRYNELLPSLTKLLKCSFPQRFDAIVTLDKGEVTSSSPFENIVLGVDTLESGNVTGCLTALAFAVRDDQMLKPFNYSVVEACGYEKRAEVRKAGVKLLFSVLNEDYIALLPECLPVLSELLEERDEEISSLAKQCMVVAEELLGESLEESLM